jgi:YVTN family beta-propeller protein
VCVTPDGSKAYVPNYGSGTVSVINTWNNTVSATITVGTNPYGVSVTPDGLKPALPCDRGPTRRSRAPGGQVHP